MSKEAMKLALEKADSRDGYLTYITEIEALREALAEQPTPVQQPVACAQIVSLNDMQGVVDWLPHNDAHLKAGDYLYNSPPAQRKPLTRKQLAEAWIAVAHITHATERQIAYARAIEAAHGIKE